MIQADGQESFLLLGQGHAGFPAFMKREDNLSGYF